MKNLIYVLMIVPALSFGQFGAHVGFSSGKAKISGGGVSVNTDSTTAVSFGLLYDAEISDNLDLLPSVSFTIGEKVEDEANNSIGLGLDLQYYVSGKDAGFFISPGLGLGITLADVDTDVVKKSAFSGQIGVGYDFSDSVTLGVGYATQLSNSSNIDGIKIRGNAFGAELQVKF
jgi:opacity protein-like surface antigen